MRYAVLVPEFMAKADGRVDSSVRRMLGRVASRCTVCRWIIDEMLVRRFPKLWEELASIIDPWHPRPPLPDPPLERREPLSEPLPNLWDAVYAEVLLDAVMGLSQSSQPTCSDKGANSAHSASPCGKRVDRSARSFLETPPPCPTDSNPRH